MTVYNAIALRGKILELIERSRHVGTNVTLYTGPELGRLAEGVGQRNNHGGYNWDTLVRNRSAKYSVILGSPKVATTDPLPTQKQVLDSMELLMTRLFGGNCGTRQCRGHLNSLPVDYVYRVMGSGDDPDFTFNCHLMVSTKKRSNHHIGYMWGKMCRQVDIVPGAEDLYILMVPDVPAGEFGWFYTFPEQRCTIGIGSDYMGEAKKGMLRMAMYLAKQRGYLGIHAGTKVVSARDATTGKLRRLGVAIMGNSGTGKTTNVGHTHFLDGEGEQSLVAQDDFVALRMRDGRVLGTEQALFLKTDLDEDDMLLRPCTQNPQFVSQNLYVDYRGEILYDEEDLCANGRGILPISALPPSRRHNSIDLPPLEELDLLYIIFNTRHNGVVPILQELTPEQAAAYFMLGESIETAAGDPSKAGKATREVGTNPFIVGDPAEEGNLFYSYLLRYQEKVRCFFMNTGGVGEIPDPQAPGRPKRQAARPWKSGIGYITRALFRGAGTWEENPDFGTKVLTGGVTGAGDAPFDMTPFDPRAAYPVADREALATALNRERLAHLERFPTLDPAIVAAFKQSHRL
jgi:phosphoenolpyruvate carboxykinase (ATP)